MGDPNGDHICWERPEDMDTPRIVYAIGMRVASGEGELIME